MKKKDFSVLVLAVEIASISFLHAFKVHHTAPPTVPKVHLSVSVAYAKPSIPLKTSFVLARLK